VASITLRPSLASRDQAGAANRWFTTWPAIDETLMMWPLHGAFMCGSAALAFVSRRGLIGSPRRQRRHRQDRRQDMNGLTLAAQVAGVA
jgi:hypothetical protein